MAELVASIAICTLNRADSLARTLQSLCEMECGSPAGFEVVIVDNGSTDHTGDVCRTFGARLPIRYVIEERRGLSNARNRAVHEARGDYICWTDDDVTVDRGWLRAYLTSFAKYPEAAFFGGRIVPVLEEPTVRWFEQNFRGPPLRYLVALRDRTVEEALRDDGYMPFGANYAVRMDAQRRFPYDPDLGVAPNRNRVGEESAVIKRILGVGLTGYWVPGAQVFHHISRDRQSERYVARYFRAVGETQAYLAASADGRSIFGAPPWVWRWYVGRLLAYYWARVLRDPKVWLLRLRDLGYIQGQLEYHLRERRKVRAR